MNLEQKTAISHRLAWITYIALLVLLLSTQLFSGAPSPIALLGIALLLPGGFALRKKHLNGIIGLCFVLTLFYCHSALLLFTPGKVLYGSLMMLLVVVLFCACCLDVRWEARCRRQRPST
jgi:uncharacterized membrane protein